MDPDFWHQRWNDNNIGFHQADFNPLMVAEFHRLGLAPGARVFVPLCGKTRDIAWLLSQGYAVAGSELSRLAVEQLFEELGVEAQITDQGPLTRFSAPGLDIWAGDFFALDADTLGPVAAIYDRAALVALPPDMRADYARHLHRITGGAPQFLIGFEYDQELMDGPPFSVGEAEAAQVYDGLYLLELITRRNIPGGIRRQRPDGSIKGVDQLDEAAWLLR